MNIYKELNKVIEYIEEHLEDEIEVKNVSRMVGMNDYTFQRIFGVLCDISFSEYIRNRRLSNAGQELYLNNGRVIDSAMKYGYNNATSFSRAFEKFHGIKPSEVRKKSGNLRLYTKLHFNEEYECNKNIDYKIVEKEELKLYGKYIITDNKKISEDAPNFYMENANKYGNAPYGIVEYENKERINVKSYWVLYYDKFDGMQEKIIPKSKWIQIAINSQEAKEIQNISKVFYREFLPNSKYNIKNLPEIEFYHDNITDFLIPIED